MPFLTKTSIRFVSFNLLRLASVVALVLALAGSITTLVSDMQGYTAYEKAAAASTSTSAARLRARSPDSGVVPAHRMVLRKREYIDPASVPGHTTYTSHSIISATASSSSKTSAATAAKATAALASSTQAAGSAASNYVAGTSVPTETGGVVFAALNRIFVCLILVLALLAEVPPATRFTDRFWKFCFPPFSAKFGTAVLGLVQVFLGSDILAKATAGFALAAAWLLFIVGFINLLFGLAFGAALKADQAFIAPAAEPKGGLRALVMNAQPHAGAGSSKFANDHRAYEIGSAVGSSAVGSSAAGSKGKKERKPIQISPPKPMAQAPAPPVYHPEGRF